jgi:hypothetical protein
MLEVERIACSNEAGFVMNFWITWIDNGGTVRWTNNNSGDFPVGQTRVFDLGQGNPSIPEGVEVWPAVRAILGIQSEGNVHLRYKKNGQTATFRVQGTTLSFSVSKV